MTAPVPPAGATPPPAAAAPPPAAAAAPPAAAAAAEAPAPPFTAKAALVTGRVLHEPFEVPTHMTKSSLLFGGAAHNLVGKLNATAAESWEALQPRGPAKWLGKLFPKVDSGVAGSADQARKALEVTWMPLSEGSHKIGHSVSNPFSLFYANRAGFELPGDPTEARAVLAGITDSKGFPTPAPAEPAPAPQEPAPQEPAPQEPAPQEPAPQEPAPQEPAPQEPAPQEPAPQEPAPQQPQGPAPQEPGPQEPAPQEPAPQEPSPQEPAPQQPQGPAPQG